MAKAENGVSAGKDDKPDNPLVQAPLASMMKVDFLLNKEGGVWLLHDKPLPGILKWVEYDADTERVMLVKRHGGVQDLGLKVPLSMGYSLMGAKEITAMLIDGDGKIVDFAIVPLVARQTIN
jgi:hypothetical protein